MLTLIRTRTATHGAFTVVEGGLPVRHLPAVLELTHELGLDGD